MSHAAHLAAVYEAQLRLGQVGAHLRTTIVNSQQFDAALLPAVGDTPGTDPGQRAAELAVQLHEALQDALRLADRIDDLLTEYRRGI